MFRGLILWVLIALLSFGPMVGWAYDQGEIAPDPPQESLSSQADLLSRVHGHLEVLKGEVISIGPEQLVLQGYSHPISLKVKPDALITVNGRRGCLAALRPVADGCYFSVRVWVDGQGRVCAIEGFYWGVEVEVLEVVGLGNNQYQMIVRTLGTEQQIYKVATIERCLGVEGKDSKSLLGAAFILFTMEGTVKRLFQ